MKSILLQETVFFQASCIHMELLLNVIKDTRNYRFWRESSLVLSLLFCTFRTKLSYKSIQWTNSSWVKTTKANRGLPSAGRLERATRHPPESSSPPPPSSSSPPLPAFSSAPSLLSWRRGKKKKRREESTKGNREIKRQRDKRGTRPMTDRKRCWLRGRERGTDGEWDKERRSGDV